MTEGLQIRRAKTDDDLQSLLALYAHLNAGDVLPGIEAAAAIWKRMLSSPDLWILLGEIDGRVVTSCTLVITANLTRGDRPYAAIENVVTQPDFRNRGLGTAILADAIGRATAQNCYKVVLTTGSKRESTLGFYEKAGFKKNTRTVFEIRA